MDDGRKELDEAYDGLQQELPDRVSSALRWLRSPGSRYVRIPLGLFLTACGLLWFLPVVGIECLPIGLLLLAEDIPALRRPIARFTLMLERKWRALRRRWQMR